MERPLEPGDYVVCPFRLGERGNFLSLAPDDRIVLIDRAQRVPITPEAPYLCRVKAQVPAREGDGVRAYVVQVQRPVTMHDYDQVHAAHFNQGTLTLRLRHPTRFRSLRYRVVQAEQELDVESSRASKEPGLRLTLRYGPLQREEILTKEEAQRRGLPLNLLLPMPRPPRPLDPLIGHPRPRAAPGWLPTLEHHTRHLVLPTAQLRPAFERTHTALGPASLEPLLRRRMAQVIALGTYDPVPPDSPDEVDLEHALVLLARHAATAQPELRDPLDRAERRVLEKQARRQPPADLLELLHAVHPGFQHETGDEYSVDLETYLDATGDRSQGAWALNNRDLKAGRVHVDRAAAATLLAALTAQHRHHEALPADSLADPIIRSVDAYARQLLAGRPERSISLDSGLERIEAFPPCVAHALRKGLQASLQAAEAHNAEAFLLAIGMPAQRAARWMQPASSPTPPSNRLEHPAGRAPIPSCEMNRALGICTWQCPNVKDPIEYYQRHRSDPQVTDGPLPEKVANPEATNPIAHAPKTARKRPASQRTSPSRRPVKKPRRMRS